jgi:hypothetical protein
MPVLAEDAFRDEVSARSPWLYVYVAFIGGGLLLSLVSVDFQLSSSEVRRNIRLCGLRIRSSVLVHRPELPGMTGDVTGAFQSWTPPEAAAPASYNCTLDPNSITPLSGNLK